MGWEMPWYTFTDGFDKDFGIDEWHGHNVFFRDGHRVFRTYFINNRGDEAMGTRQSREFAVPTVILGNVRKLPSARFIPIYEG
jgi:predicted dithiol-disulfide oxidoreductase (DUF899 family)